MRSSSSEKFAFVAAGLILVTFGEGCDCCYGQHEAAQQSLRYVLLMMHRIRFNSCRLER